MDESRTPDNGVDDAPVAENENGDAKYQVPKGGLGFLGAAQLSPLESEGEFALLFEAMIESVSPEDALEWIYTSEAIDETWSVMRWRRALRVRLALARREAIIDIFNTSQGNDILLSKIRDKRFGEGSTHWMTNEEASVMLADEVIAGDKEALKAFNALMLGMGLAEREIEGAALLSASADIEIIERHIDSAFGRRERLLRELDRRRSVLGQRIRVAVQKIQNTDHRES